MLPHFDGISQQKLRLYQKEKRSAGNRNKRKCGKGKTKIRKGKRRK